MRSDYLKFMQILCSLHDGKNYVSEADIRRKWKRCPSHEAILNFGKDIYFDYNSEPSAPAYIPTVQGRELVSSAISSKHSAILNVATFIVALLTLAATILIPLLQPLLQK